MGISLRTSPHPRLVWGRRSVLPVILGWKTVVDVTEEDKGGRFPRERERERERLIIPMKPVRPSVVSRVDKCQSVRKSKELQVG